MNLDTADTASIEYPGYFQNKTRVGFVLGFVLLVVFLILFSPIFCYCLLIFVVS